MPFAWLARLHADQNPSGALREIGLAADVPADEPTTEGVITALERHDLTGIAWACSYIPAMRMSAF